MSQVVKLSDIATMDDDDVIKAVKGTLTKLYPRKSGVGDNGPWSFESGELSDGKTSVKITFKDREALPKEMKGRQIYILAYHGEKGWSGVKKKTDDYKPENPVPMIWVTKTAEVTLVEGGAPAKEQDAGGDDGDVAPKTKAGNPTYQQKPTPANITGHNTPVFGGTVGMAIKEGVAWVRELGASPNDPAAFKQIYEIASDLIRISRKLESGELAPNTKKGKSHAEPDGAAEGDDVPN